MLYGELNLNKVNDCNSMICFCPFSVPNTLNGRLKIDNMEFLDKYRDHSSFIYRTLTREIEEGIKESLNSYKDANVKVLNLT